CCRRPEPRRSAGRGLRATAQTRAESGFFGGGGTGYETHVFEPRGGRGTDRSAVDAGRHYSYEEFPVESGIAAPGCEIADVTVEVHRSSIRITGRECWPFSDINVGGMKTISKGGRDVSRFSFLVSRSSFFPGVAISQMCCLDERASPWLALSSMPLSM